MALTIKGQRLDITPKVIVVNWRESGELSGSFAGCELIRSAAGLADGEYIGPGEGPFTLTAAEHLREPSSVAILASRVLDNLEVTGNMPAARTRSANKLH